MVQNFIQNHLLKKSIISLLLYPFSLIYSLLMIIRRKTIKPKKTNVKVISIGNIIAGGSGKTPFCLFLCKYLTSKGYKIAVSHRGYKGLLEKNETIISTPEKVLEIAEQAGDEAKLLATKLKGIPVVVGSNRYKAVNLVKKQYPMLDFVILDDSFQHIKLYHDFDFVVFNKLSGVGNGFVFPAGILREPLTAIKYANCVVYNGAKSIKGLKHNKPVISGSYKLLRFYSKNGTTVSPENAKNVLVSGIGNPIGFEKTMQENGISYEKHFVFSDHYHFDDKAEIDKISKYCKANSIDFIITTEKDFTKLAKQNLNLAVCEIGFECDNFDIIYNKIKNLT